MAKKQQESRPHLIPNIEDWPIYKLSEDRKQFVSDITEYTFRQLLEELNSSKNIGETLFKTVYVERIRVKEDPWKVDPTNEAKFWNKVQKALVEKEKDTVNSTGYNELLQQVIRHYAEEIVGTFRIRTFRFARKFLTMFFSRLLIAARTKSIYQFWGSKHRLSDRMKVEGNIDHIRNLMKKGILVIVPTHFSNLDSILVGYAMDTFVGLPSFSYGAGLNLYNSGYAAYFMNRLGAYRLDRRKKNVIYLETLKSMSNLSLQRGVNSLFFPGGTRSRSGSVETKLKLGLLSTAVEAQRGIFEKGGEEKIFVVPLVISYHFVLEAQYLIEQHLKSLGKEKYVRRKDDSNSLRKILTFAWHSFSQTSDIILSFGQPMDVVGNPVDSNGLSFDQYNNPVDIREYFFVDNQITKDRQRDFEYTLLLSKQIVNRFYKDNIVLASHLVAFAAFEILKFRNAKLDLFSLLRLPPDEWVFDKDELIDVVSQLQGRLRDMEKSGDIKLSPQIRVAPMELIKDGIKRLGSYHTSKPIKFNRKKDIVSDSFSLLFYYHNRLENYNLEKHIHWKR